MSEDPGEMCEDPVEMLLLAVFHQSLHCLQHQGLDGVG